MTPDQVAYGIGRFYADAGHSRKAVTRSKLAYHLAAKSPDGVYVGGIRPLASLAGISPRQTQKILFEFRDRWWLSMYQAKRGGRTYYRLHFDRLPRYDGCNGIWNPEPRRDHAIEELRALIARHGPLTIAEAMILTGATAGALYERRKRAEAAGVIRRDGRRMVAVEDGGE